MGTNSGTKGTKEVDKDWPVTEGDTLATTKIEGKQINLTAEGINGVKTIVPNKDKELL